MSKPLEELTDAEMAELRNADWTEVQIMAAISLALQDGAMEAVVDLIARLERKNPRKAALLVDFIKLTAVVEQTATDGPA